MTIAKEAEEVLSDEKILLCCFCRQFMTDPWLLKCLHSCCKRCLQNAGENRETIECALCKEDTDWGSVMQNFYLACRIHFRDFLKGNLKCGTCFKDAEHSCKSCCLFLCGDCLYSHESYHRDHEVVALLEMNGDSAMTFEQMCTVDDRPYIYACTECQKATCEACVHSCDESQHRLLQLPTEAADYVQKIKDNIAGLNRHLKCLAETLANRKTALDIVDEAYNASSNTLRQNKRRIREALDGVFAAAEDQLQKMYNDLRPKALHSKEVAKRLSDKVHHATDYCEQITETGQDTDVITQQRLLILRLQSLIGETEDMEEAHDATESIEIETSQIIDIEKTLKSYVGLPKKFGGYDSDGFEARPEKVHTDIRRGPSDYSIMAYSSFQSSSACRDIIFTAEGNLAVAALKDGLIEYKPSGEKLSEWKPENGSDLVWTVDSLQDNRVVVGMYPANCVIILKLEAARDRNWFVDARVEVLRRPAYSLSVHSSVSVNVKTAEIAAVAECGNVNSDDRPISGSEIVLLQLEGNKCAWRKLLGHRVGCIAITEYAVVASSDEKLSFSSAYSPDLGTPPSYVIEGFAHSGELLWQQTCDDKVYDMSAMRAGEIFFVTTNSGVQTRSSSNGVLRIPNLPSAVSSLNGDLSVFVRPVSGIVLVAVSDRHSKTVSVYVGSSISDDQVPTESRRRDNTPQALAPSSHLEATYVTSKLTPRVIDAEIKEVEKKVGLLSYYFSTDSLIIHVEDPTKKVQPGEVKALVENALRKYSGQRLDVVVHPYGARCLFSGVGAPTMHVGASTNQVIAMYLPVRNNCFHFWFSFAHGYLRELLAARRQVTCRVATTAVAMHRRDAESMMHIDVPLSEHYPWSPNIDHDEEVAYVLFASSGFVIHKGKPFLHSIDIMGGFVPQAISTPSFSSINGTRNPDSIYEKCCMCSSSFCNNSQHPASRVMYSILGVSEFPLCEDEKSCWLDCSRLYNSSVYCWLGEKKGLAKGRVICPELPNRLFLKFAEGPSDVFEMSNLLIIEPLGDAKPDLGDCGHIWVEATKDGFKAVAITNGIHEMPHPNSRGHDTANKIVWLAVLMQAALIGIEVQF